MQRYHNNPVISRSDIRSLHPALRDVSSVFNPGAILYKGDILLLLRVQNRARETFLMKATSDDGMHFHISETPVLMLGAEAIPFKVYHIYDPRISHIDGTYHVITAIDTNKGCFLGWWTTQDFDTLHFEALVSEPNVRNGVLFSHKINGLYHRFERPNDFILENGVRTGNAICLSTSDNLRDWSAPTLVMQGNPCYWDELIGSGPPPIKTREGWLHIYHGVATHFGSSNIYQMGVSLHDLDHPATVIARGRYNILEPRELYELTGQVPNVVFPSGCIVRDTDKDGFAAPDAEVHIYYGAADTSVCLALTTIEYLLGEVHAL